MYMYNTHTHMHAVYQVIYRISIEILKIDKAIWDLSVYLI